MTLGIPPAGYSPGRFIQDALDDRLQDHADLARELGMHPWQIDRLIADKMRITPKLSALLGLVFGVSPALWLDIQASYDRHRKAK